MADLHRPQKVAKLFTLNPLAGEEARVVYKHAVQQLYHREVIDSMVSLEKMVKG